MLKSSLTVVLTIVLLTSGLFTVVTAQPKTKKRQPTDFQFRELDKNGDKQISEAEFLGEKTKNARDNARILFTSLDQDRSGHLSGEEFKTIKRLLTRPGQTGGGANEWK